MKINKFIQLMLIAATIGLISASIHLVTNTGAQNKFSQLFFPNKRILIASLETNLSLPNKKFKVIKLQQNRDLWIEIYDLNLGEDRIAEFKIPAKIDGQMFANKKSSSLFASDIDGDQILEIIAPSFDNDLIPHVHAFKYNPITDRFLEVSNKGLLQQL